MDSIFLTPSFIFLRPWAGHEQVDPQKPRCVMIPWLMLEGKWDRDIYVCWWRADARCHGQLEAWDLCRTQVLGLVHLSKEGWQCPTHLTLAWSCWKCSGHPRQPRRSSSTLLECQQQSYQPVAHLQNKKIHNSQHLSQRQRVIKCSNIQRSNCLPHCVCFQKREKINLSISKSMKHLQSRSIAIKQWNNAVDFIIKNVQEAFTNWLLSINRSSNYLRTDLSDLVWLYPHLLNSGTYF